MEGKRRTNKPIFFELAITSGLTPVQANPDFAAPKPRVFRKVWRYDNDVSLQTRLASGGW